MLLRCGISGANVSADKTIVIHSKKKQSDSDSYNIRNILFIQA